MKATIPNFKAIERKIQLFGFIIFSFFGAYGQNPSDGCSGVPSLTVNSTCINTAYTLSGTYTNGGLINSATCVAGNDRDDGWYSFVATSTGTTINVTGNEARSVVVWTSCGGGTELGCNQATAGNTASVTVATTPGVTYYVQIHRRSGNGTANMNGNICLFESAPPPSACADMTINSTNFSQTGLTTCGFGDDYSSANACGSSYMNGDDIVIAYTPTTTECVSFTLSNTDTWVGIFLTDDCPNAGGVTCLASNTNSAGNPSISGFNVTAGTTYYLTVSTFPAPQCTDFDLNIAACPPPGVCGDITVNTTYYSQTGLTTCGFGDDYSSANACGSSYMNGDDIVIAYTPTTTECVQIALSNTGTWVGVFLTDGCPNDAGVNCLASATNSAGNPVIGGYTVTAGTTYYITVSTFPSPQCTPFGISIAACPPPPPNDECSNAISVPVTPQGGACSSTAGYITNATTSSQANTCGGTADDDVWYSFVATSTDVQIDLTGISGSTSDMYFSVYAGSCGAPGVPLLCSDPNSGQVSGLTIGNTYFIRIYSWTSTGGQNVNFNLCVGEIGPCGIASTTEDYCPYAATLTQGPGSWTSTTYDYYTADLPGNVNSVFCGSIENNSWYQFTALSTTEVFNITNVSACANGWGVQMQVYDVTTNASGCCTNFASMSNCYNPGTTTLGTVTATGLTIGNTYILMVDGNAGDNCAFTISGWTATGIILPVELMDFGGISREIENIIHWKTATEQNNDYFEIQRSYDGLSYENIGTRKGKGTTTEVQNYVFNDGDVRNGVVYYRLKQYDFDGKSQTSETISLNRQYLSKGISSIYPNPAEQNVTVELSTANLHGKIILRLMSMEGKVLRIDEINNYSDVLLHKLNIAGLTEGMYILQLSDENGFSQTKRLIKKQ